MQLVVLGDIASGTAIATEIADSGGVTTRYEGDISENDHALAVVRTAVNTVGQLVKNALALSHIVFGVVFDRSPGLKLLAAHGGGYLPTYLGRSDNAWKVRPEARRCAEPPATIFGASPSTRSCTVRTLCARSSTPLARSRWFSAPTTPSAWANDDPVAEVRAAGLTDEVTRAKLADNAFRLGLSTEPLGTRIMTGPTS